MGFLENLESSWEDEPSNGYVVNPKVAKIIQEMINDPDHQALMKKLADMDDDFITEDHLKEYEKRLRYMEEYGI